MISDLQYRKRNVKLLIVEDEEITILFYQQIFSKFINNLYFAKDGAQGIEFCKKIMPDVIISDINMPEINGIEMTKYLKSQPETEKIPVLLCSTLYKSEIVTDISCCDEYFSKPLTIDNVKSILNKYFVNQVCSRK